tara:strand:- start:52 stop:447 length:396 start_codon:yes stop_codon:yes gene_type:complete
MIEVIWDGRMKAISGEMNIGQNQLKNSSRMEVTTRIGITIAIAVKVGIVAVRIEIGIGSGRTIGSKVGPAIPIAAAVGGEAGIEIIKLTLALVLAVQERERRRVDRDRGDVQRIIADFHRFHIGIVFYKLK